ncbi:fluoride efflux transporter CrcB [Archaeoglobus sp.]
MLRDVLIVGVGGFIGAIARFTISGIVQDNFTFPVGTLFVNVVGSFFLSLIMYSTEFVGLFSDETRMFLTVGILGAFTTMSTFSYESFKLLESGEIRAFILNVVLTVTLTLIAVFLGRAVAIAVWKKL